VVCLYQEGDRNVERYRIVRGEATLPAGRPPAGLARNRTGQLLRVATMRRRITKSATMAAPISVNGAGSGTWRSGSVP